MIVSGSSKYYSTPFTDEKEIEKVVTDYAEYLFGSSILFLPKSRISTIGGKDTIPDGFVVDVEREEWFMVEAELASHGTWQHIAPQISKQIVAIDSKATREKILRTCLDIIRMDKTAANVFAELNIGQLEIHGKLQSILSKDPTIAIPIDNVPADLESWINTIKFQVKIWRIEKFQSQDGGITFYSIPDENIPSITTVIKGGKSLSTVVNRLSQPYQDMLQAGLITEGQTVFFDYGPRGKPKNTWQGFLRKDGVEVDGKVMSLSAAAVYCMHQYGSIRETANGWTAWKTENGIYLADLYNKLPLRQLNEQETK